LEAFHALRLKGALNVGNESLFEFRTGEGSEGSLEQALCDPVKYSVVRNGAGCFSAGKVDTGGFERLVDGFV
jgi:hypothetical protein